MYRVFLAVLVAAILAGCASRITATETKSSEGLVSTCGVTVSEDSASLTSVDAVIIYKSDNCDITIKTLP